MFNHLYTRVGHIALQWVAFLRTQSDLRAALKSLWARRKATYCLH